MTSNTPDHDALPTPGADTMRPASGRPRRRAHPSGADTMRAMRDRTRRTWVDDADPTVPLAPVRAASGLTAEVERSVLDLVLRAGEVMVATGAPVAETTATMLRLADAFGVKNCHVDITFVSITVSIDRDDDPVTRVRVVNVRTSDYTRQIELHRLVDDTVTGGVSLDQAHERLDEILAAPHPYRRKVVTIALGVFAAGVAVLLGGGWLVAAMAAATTMVVDRSLRRLRHRGLPHLFQQAIGAIIPTVVALTLLWGQGRFGWDLQLLPPSLVVASGIVVLLAGLSLVGAAHDAITGFPLTSAARSWEVMLSTLGIVIGIGFVLGIGQRIGVPLTMSDPTSFAPSLATQVVAGGVITGAWAVASYTHWRALPLFMGVGAAAGGTSALVQMTSIGPAGSAFCAALVVGLVAGLAGRRMRIPSMVIAACGITPLLPGLAIYAGMFQLVNADNILAGTERLLGAVGIGLAVAAGVTLGEFVATPLRANANRWQRWLQRRARGTRI